MPSNQEAAAARIRAALAERDEDAITLSRQTGLDKAVIYGLLNGQRWPRPASRAKIERHFGWELGALEHFAAGDDTSSVGGRRVVLNVDPEVFADLSETEREEAAAAATAAFMERARQIRAFRS